MSNKLLIPFDQRYYPKALSKAISSLQLNFIYRKMVLRQLNNIKYGQIELSDPLALETFGEQSNNSYPLVRLTIHDLSFYKKLVFNGGIGLGEAYFLGLWDCPDLLSLIRILAYNLSSVQSLGKGLSRIGRFVNLLQKMLQKNSLTGSRKNISAHYDLSNAFFAQFLDKSMMYSAASFSDERMTLEEAAMEKIEKICRKLKLKPTDHLLEIGTGWGELAVYAVKNYGCRVTTTTISEEQYQFALQKVHDEGLDDLINVLKRDYRLLEGQYDKLVSVEMLEAVGHQYFEHYFKICNNLLKPEGVMVLQTITIDDQRYDQALKSMDFIQRYIFPGGSLPCVSAISKTVGYSTSLRILDMEDMTMDYALTIEQWRKRFLSNISEIKNLGFPETFIRMWYFYFCYCEGAFREYVIGCKQFTFANDNYRWGN